MLRQRGETSSLKRPDTHVRHYQHLLVQRCVKTAIEYRVSGVVVIHEGGIGCGTECCVEGERRGRRR